MEAELHQLVNRDTFLQRAAMLALQALY